MEILAEFNALAILIFSIWNIILKIWFKEIFILVFQTENFWKFDLKKFLF